MIKKLLALFLTLSVIMPLSACASTETASAGSGDASVSENTAAEPEDTTAQTTAETALQTEAFATTVKEEETIPGGYSSYKEAYEAGEKIPALYERHDDDFSIGAAISSGYVKHSEYSSVLTTHFNSVTAENEMKPYAIIDINRSASNLAEYDLSPAVKFDSVDAVMRFAKENNMKARFHVLVWHGQTPDAFFKVGYKNSGENVTREVMLSRMENYIKQVLEYLDANYPGMVYAVDVVNEAIETGDSRKDGLRDSLWLQTIGPDFVEMAFAYARKYAPDYMKLYYNDYGCHENSKRYYITEMLKPIIEKGNIDGMGLQSHYSLDSPTTIEVQDTIIKYADLGLDIQITELDINTTDGTEEGLSALAIRYKKLMNAYKHIKSKGLANITNITVWGLSDAQSWLNDAEKKYPLLFDRELKIKDSFWGMYQDSSIPNY